MINVVPSKRHMEARDAIIKGLRTIEDLDPLEMLAVSAIVVGQLIALQDQTKYTAADLMELVGKNIEAGNADAIAEIMDPKGSA